MMDISDLFEIIGICLETTIVVEVILALILGYRKKDLLNIVLVNIMTNPLVVTIPLFISHIYRNSIAYVVLYILEILTVIVEGLIYKKYLKERKINPFSLSFVLNLCSYLIGIVILEF